MITAINLSINRKNDYVRLATNRRSVLQYNPAYRLNHDIVSFSGKSQEEKSLYAQLMESYSKTPNGDVPFDVFCEKIISDDGKIIGMGEHKVVYSMPFMDDYVLAREKKIPHRMAQFTPTDVKLTKYNFGQPLATNNADLFVMKRVKGKSYSVPNWIELFKQSLFGTGKVSEEQAKIFLDNITKLADFDLKEYVKLADMLNYLSENGIVADFINPNNLIIDYKNQEINFIDLPLHWEKHLKNVEDGHNGSEIMVLLLLDWLMHDEYLEVLKDEDRQKLAEASRKVIKKCNKAADIVGLSTNLPLITYISERIRVSYTPAIHKNLKLEGLYEKYHDCLNWFL